jgi:hypothetical protein
MVTLAALAVASLSMDLAAAGGATELPTTYPVICRGPEGRAFVQLNSPLPAGQSQVSESALQNAVLHLTDAHEIRELERQGLVIDNGQSSERFHEMTSQEFRDKHLSLIAENSRIRYIGGRFTSGPTLAVESHHRSPVVLGRNEASRELPAKLQVNLRTDRGMSLKLEFNAYTPEIRRCTRTEMVPNPWASLSPSIPELMEVCAADQLVTPETLVPVHTTTIQLTACENR